MSWRNELTIGILRAERLFLGTENGGLGDEITFAEMDVINGVVPGVGAANKALVLDENADILSGINDFNIDGDLTVIGDMDLDDLDLSGSLTVDGGSIIVGEQDVVAGAIFCSGHLTGSTIGGKIELQNAADHDNTIDSYSIRVVEDDLLIGPNSDTDALIYGGAGDQWSFTTAAAVLMTGAGGLDVSQEITSLTGVIKCGVDDVTSGDFIAYGGETTSGGEFRAHTPADEDTTIDYFVFRVTDDDLQIGPDTDSDALAYLGATDQWSFNTAAVVLVTGAGGIQATGGLVLSGVDDTARGKFVAYGADTVGNGNGGEYRAHTPDDEDGSIEYYVFKAAEDDLFIGPDNDTDALMYDGDNTRWEFTAGAPVNIAGGWLIAGTAVDATAAELNILDGQAAAVVFSPSGGSGTGTNELTFNDAAGVKMAIPTSGVMYFSSTDAGLDFLPITTSVVTSKGNVDKEGAAAGADLFHFVTDAAGELDFTITAAADDYFCVVVLPNGKLQISAVITVS